MRGDTKQARSGAPTGQDRIAGFARQSRHLDERTRVRVRLTDQALAAVSLARAVASSDQVTAAMLLVGLAAEPDGRAGRLLRDRASAAAVLTERAGAIPSSSLDDVLRHAVDAARKRPIATGDLLRAVVEVGGTDVQDLLDHAGYDIAALMAPAGASDAETFAWGSDTELDAEAAVVVSQVRALDGGAVDLVLAVAETATGERLHLDAEQLRARRALGLRSTPVAGAGAWDAGLQAVVQAAALIRRGDQTTAMDLLIAASVAGGEGPRFMLEEAE